MACNQPTQQTPQQVLRNVELFEWTDSITPQKITELIEHFASLKNEIDVIQDFEYGTDVSVEWLCKKNIQCFIVTFDSEKGRDTYLSHPEHKIFGDSVTPWFKNVLVVDYIIQN
ncbi:Dabb family protein [Saccharicrinis sp. 156]|uniref:Dabb family protein n=1 Tax=Saccharicrinis sp. 156 TaxID=3417574 RepID=UPI003D355E6C